MWALTPGQEHILRKDPLVIGRPPLLRQTNAGLLLRLLRESGPCSKADLVRASGLSAPTVTNVVAHLASAGLVEPIGEGGSTGGAPAGHFAISLRARMRDSSRDFAGFCNVAGGGPGRTRDGAGEGSIRAGSVESEGDLRIDRAGGAVAAEENQEDAGAIGAGRSERAGDRGWECRRGAVVVEAEELEGRTAAVVAGERIEMSGRR